MSSGEPDEPEGELGIGPRPDADKLVRAVARARIANKLFAKSEQVQLGRYHLLELVGSGGMGVVWGAWDPELERRVAIKLVKATVRAARERIQLEGQALAKLSHPNVVTVYDVGVVDDQVYIVMEWVRGHNLRDYGRTPRTVRALVSVYRAAGEGLAAAHAAGLIHRDFKPDNAIVGDDERVRVLDFGLARSEARGDDHGAAGTPRYMAPEQAAGCALTPAVDQYAFCVALREQLIARDGEPAEVPGWLAAIVARGTAADPAARFPSMRELLAALARDPATIWRRRLIAGAAVAATGAAFAVGALASGPGVEPCSGAPGDMRATWGPPARIALGHHLQALGAYGAAEAPRLTGELSSYADRWAATHRAACTANQRGELTSALYEHELGCLGRARAGLAAAIDVLSHVPNDRLSDAIIASRGLPSSEACLDASVASAVEPPAPALAARATALGNELARLRVLAQAADPSVATAATATLTAAQQLGYLPLVGRAYLLQGLDLGRRGETARAASAFDQAATTALDAGDQATFVEAYARQLFMTATSEQPVPDAIRHADTAAPYVEHIARRLGSAAAFERPLLYNNLGVARMSAGDKPAARAWFAKAIDEPRTRDGDIELVSAIGNLALITEQPAERDRLFGRERTILISLLGPNHIRALEATYKASVFDPNPATAAARLRDVCARVQAFHADENGGLAGRCAYELGWLADARGDADETRRAMRQVGDIRRPIAAAYLALLDGHAAEALRGARAAAAQLQDTWWNKFYAGDALVLAARCAELLHDPAAAALAGDAVAIYESLTVIAQTPYYQRRLARARETLARLKTASR